MMRNLLFYLENIGKSTTIAVDAEQKYLYSVDKVVLDDKIALVYVIVGRCLCFGHNTCYTWINTYGEVETQLYRISEQATGLGM